MPQTYFETVVRERADSARRLRELGLDLAGMDRIVRAGEDARAECVDYDPLPSPGMDAYRYRVRAMRTYYVPRGWLCVRDKGLEPIELAESR